MTSRKAARDVPASVRQRLLNLARERRLRFEGVLQRFAVERFLYRLSASDEMIAEKFHAMVSLGDANSRMKDLWDVACLARRFAFDGDTLRTTIAEAFRHRGTSLADGRPTALLAAYYDEHESPARGQRRRELRQQIASDIDGPDRLEDVGEELRRFLGPVCDSLTEEKPFTQAWPPRGPWRHGVQDQMGGKDGD